MSRPLIHFASRPGEPAQQVALLQDELAENKAEVAPQIEAAAALQQQCSEAKSELARQRDASSISQMEAQKATDRIALLDDELRAARAEIAGHMKAVDAARAITEDATGQVTALRGSSCVREAKGPRRSPARRGDPAASARDHGDCKASTRAGSPDRTAGRSGTTEHAGDVQRAADLALSNDEIRQQLERTQQELHRVHTAIAETLAQPRYVIADRCNAWARKAGVLHAALKRVWLARYRQ